MQISFLDDVIATGKLFVDEDSVRVMGAADQTFPRSSVLTITAGAPKERNYWAGKITLGANLREGNTEQVEFSTQASFKRRTPKNRVNFDYLGNFNRTFGEVAADNQRFDAGWNRYFSNRLFWTPVYGEYYRDPFQNIDSRWTLGMGAGYTLIDTKKIEWEITGGLAYQITQFDDVLEGESDSANTPTLVFGTAYDHELTKSIDFIFNYRFFIVNEESGTYTHHLLTGLEFELTNLLDFDITFVWDRIQDPRELSDGTFPEQDDFRLTFGLGINL
jgi:putative salt-induced outer membrane protein YdiY